MLRARRIGKGEKVNADLTRSSFFSRPELKAMCLAIPARVLAVQGARTLLDVRGNRVDANAGLGGSSPGTTSSSPRV
jgi:hypothetical protein